MGIGHASFSAENTHDPPRPVGLWLSIPSFLLIKATSPEPRPQNMLRALLIYFADDEGSVTNNHRAAAQ